MPLEKLKLVNFQSHEKLCLGFDPQITTITGPTDRGKSAILRALRWICLNDIRGDAFVKEGEDHAVVLLKVDGEKIKRVRGGSKNLYFLDEEEFVAFGNGVPKDVQFVLNTSSINFQDQHDPPFWFNLNPGDVSRQLNSVIDLGIIDQVMSNVGAAVRSSHGRVAMSKERLEEAKTELEDLKPQWGRVKDFGKLKAAYEEQTEAEESRDRLGEVVESIRSNQAEALLLQAKEAEDLLRLGVDLRENTSTVHRLKNLCGGLHVHASQMQPPPNFTPVEDAHTQWEEATERLEDLSNLLDRIGQQKEDWDRKTKNSMNVEVEFHQSTKGKACPFCGKTI